MYSSPTTSVSSTLSSEVKCDRVKDYNLTKNSTPKLFKRREPTDWQIFVKNLSGKTLTITCLPDCSIKELKQKIRAIDGPHPNMRLITGGRQLEDDKKVKEYIGCEGTIHIVLRLKGGGEYPVAPFPFNSLSKKLELDYSPEAPAWRIVTQGLNLYGTCLNKVCRAFNQAIYIQTGIGTFHMPKIVYTAKCPLCQATAKKVKNLGFHDCKYEFTGMQKGKEEEITQKGETQDGKFLTFSGRSDTAWLYLEITTTKKN